MFSGATDAGVQSHARNDEPNYNAIPATLDGVVLERLEVTGNWSTPELTQATEIWW